MKHGHMHLLHGSRKNWQRRALSCSDCIAVTCSLLRSIAVPPSTTTTTAAAVLPAVAFFGVAVVEVVCPVVEGVIDVALAEADAARTAEVCCQMLWYGG